MTEYQQGIYDRLDAMGQVLVVGVVLVVLLLTIVAVRNLW
jgi:hypothetical protein